MQIRNGTQDSFKIKIVETIAFQLATSCVDHTSILERMIVDYHDTKWCELPILLSCLRALNFTHQLGHWTANGDAFYSDHLFFERLYNDILPEIDSVAEKTVGMGGSIMMNAIHQADHESLLIKIMCSENTNIPNSGELVRRSYEAEMHFLGILSIMATRLQTNGCWTIGVENLFGEIADKHEEHAYLLKQRVTG